MTRSWDGYSLSGLPWWLSGKESTCQCRRHRSVPRSGRSPGEGNGNPLQKSHGQRSLASYSPWGRKGAGHVSVTKRQFKESLLSPLLVIMDTC